MVAMFFVACSGGSSSGGGGATNPTPQGGGSGDPGGNGGGGSGGTGGGGATTGSFKAQTQIDPDDPSQFTVGCNTLGVYDPKPQVDLRLQAGQVYDSVQRFTSGTSTKSLEVRSTVVSADAQALVERLTLIGSTGIPSLPSGLEAVVTCNMAADGSQFECTSNPELPGINPFEGGQYQSCAVEEAESANTTAHQGTYTLAGGKTVSAVRFETTINGAVICDGQDMGAGRTTMVQVFSNDVPSQGSENFCGGTWVFSSYSTHNASGQLIAAEAERTAIP